MGSTTHFGLTKFGPEGRLTDDGSKYTLRDRETIDALLWTLANHDHQSTGGSDTLPDPVSTSFPVLVLGAAGALAAGRDYHYKFSYMDSDGNETAASTASTITTPSPLPPPPVMLLGTATTGGTLVPGTYKYALSYYQPSGETTAPNIATIVVPTGTSTNTITITLSAIADGATGWKIYRKSPGDQEYWLLATQVAPAATYVDNGSISPDCTKKRATSNTTNTSNSVSISIPGAELPLDGRVVAWRVYRTSIGGVYASQSLVATVVETTTEGGSDLVTSYVDTGGLLGTGVPLQQSAVPPVVPQLDASRVFADAGRLPSAFAPLGIRQHNSFLPGVLTAKTYNRFYVPHDMLLERIDLFFITAPTGVDGSNYVTVRVKDDGLVNEVQSIFNTAAPQNEIQFVSNTATAGTFTLTYSAQTTASIAYNATPAAVEAALELLSNITDVQVSGAGTSGNPWVVEFVNPGNQNVAQMTATDTLTGGVTTIYTSIQGSDGGTFTLSDGVTTTSAIAYNASAATIKTRLETDITAITTVTVTGLGTAGSPWIVTFTNPAATNFPLLIANDTSLNGVTTVVEVTRGGGNTVVDVPVTTTAQYQFWQSSLTDFFSQEAEEAPATGGATVSDTLAGNDVAIELATQNQENEWQAGILDRGTYTARFYVSNYDKTSTFTVRIEDRVGAPVVLATKTVSDPRSVYTPAYELEFTTDGTLDIYFVVKKTDTGTDRVRVDRYEYEVQLPTLRAGTNTTVEVLVTGTPTTNGSDVQATVWY